MQNACVPSAAAPSEKYICEIKKSSVGCITILFIQKKLAKILTMEAKIVKTNKRTKSSQKWLKSDVSCHYFEPL